MAQPVQYSILVGPGGYIVLNLDTADVVSGVDRRAAADQLRNAIDAEYPRTDRIKRPAVVRFLDSQGDTIADIPGSG